VTASDDGTVRLWPVLPLGAELVAHARNVLPPDRTLSEELLGSMHVLPATGDGGDVD